MSGVESNFNCPLISSFEPKFLNFLQHFCNHSVSTQSMICVIHIKIIFVSIRRNFFKFHIFFVVCHKLSAEQKHHSGAVVFSLLFLLFKNPNNIPKNNRYDKLNKIKKIFFPEKPSLSYYFNYILPKKCSPKTDYFIR